MYIEWLNSWLHYRFRVSKLGIVSCQPVICSENNPHVGSGLQDAFHNTAPFNWLESQNDSEWLCSLVVVLHNSSAKRDYIWLTGSWNLFLGGGLACKGDEK